MALKYPDELKHNNPDYAVVDAEFVRGGGRVVANLTALYALSAKLDQLKERVTKVYVSAEAKYYNLKDIANVGNANGWEVENVGGGGTSVDYSIDIEADKLSTTKVSAIKTLYDWAVAKFAAATHSHTKADVGLGNVDNTSDSNKPVSTATQTALNAKSDTNHNHTLAGLSEKSYNSLTDKPTIPAALDYSTNIETDKLSTTKVSAIKTLYDWAVAKFAAATHSHTKADVGLGNVDNTSDTNKPVSTATQTALNSKVDKNGTDRLASIAEVSLWNREIIPLVCSDETSDIIASTTVAKLRYVMPAAFTLNSLFAELNVAATGGNFTVDIKKNGTSIFTTMITFDSGEISSRTAATSHVINGTISFVLGDIVEVFVTNVGSVTAGRGLKIYLTTTKV